MRRDAPLVQQGAGIIELAVLDPGTADQDRRPAVGGLARQFLDRGAACRLERRLQHQIFRRIAGDEQFGQHDEIGAVGRACARAARALAALPATSPTVGFNWASVIVN